MKSSNPVVFTVTMFCENCHKNKLPKKGIHFLVFGHDSQELHLHKASRDGHFGYTPHIITVDSVLPDGRFKVFASCGIIGCGWSLKIGEDEDFIPDCLLARTIYLEALEYSALKKYRDDDYYLD